MVVAKVEFVLRGCCQLGEVDCVGIASFGVSLGTAVVRAMCRMPKALRCLPCRPVNRLTRLQRANALVHPCNLCPGWWYRAAIPQVTRTLLAAEDRE